LNRRHQWKWLLTATAFAVGLALIASACGGGGKKSSTSSSGGTTTGGTATGKTFANFRLAYDTGIDYLDPGLSYTVEGWQIMWNVYLPLLGYKHAAGPDGATIVPYLAQDLPKVSSDGKTYELTLRSGLKYSDGTAVKASDFAATIERDFKSTRRASASSGTSSAQTRTARRRPVTSAASRPTTRPARSRSS